jgi:cytochrome c oxidase assembly protein subunit 15
VHFIHRTLAYIITLLIIVWHLRAKKIVGATLFSKLRSLPLLMVVLQVVLGILTVLFANSKTALLWLGVAHQFTGMMFLLMMMTMVYLVRKK